MNNYENLKKINHSHLASIFEINDEELKNELKKIFFEYEIKKNCILNNHKLNKQNEK